jgi:4-hydroxybenzoate polyprenyltransferase
MITRLRLLLLLVRPPVAVLLLLFASIALANVRASGAFAASAVAATVIVGYLVFSVAVNDIADEAIDRVNLAGDKRRPLASGSSPRRDLAIIGGVGAAVAIATAAATDLPLLVVTLAGFGLSAAYSLPPLRLAERGALAALLLPGCYVCIPYLCATYAAHAALRPSDVMLLAGLYAGFLGRIVLKDFRDVRGDALFGKRTFLVRHGRRATCRLSAVGWASGSILLALAAGPHAVAFDVTGAAATAAALCLLRRLSTETNLRDEQWTISALAIIGRGTIISLLAQIEMSQRHWAALPTSLVIATLALITAGQAALMLQIGPRGRSIPVTHGWAEPATQNPDSGVYPVDPIRA